MLDVLDLEDRVRDLEADIVTYRDLTRAALAAVAERDREIRRLRADNAFFRAQLRAAISGRTIAAERQDMDREALDREHGHDATDEADDAHGRAA